MRSNGQKPKGQQKISQGEIQSAKFHASEPAPKVRRSGSSRIVSRSQTSPNDSKGTVGCDLNLHCRVYVVRGFLVAATVACECRTSLTVVCRRREGG